MTASASKEDRLIAWAFIVIGLPVMAIGFLAGYQSREVRSTEGIIMMSFTFAISLIVLAITFPVLRSNREKNVPPAPALSSTDSPGSGPSGPNNLPTADG